MLLARAGHSVLLVDRARFPSEIPHGHFIHRHGPTRLSRWGLLDRVLATGSPAVTSLLVDFGDFLLAGHKLVVDGVPVGLGPRRGALDGVLVSAAVEAGRGSGRGSWSISLCSPTAASSASRVAAVGNGFANRRGSSSAQTA